MDQMKNNRTLNLSTITGALIQHVVNLTFDQSIATGEVNLERATLIEQLGLALQMDEDVSEYTFSALRANGFCAPKYSHAFIAALALRLLKDEGKQSFEECWSQTEQSFEDCYRPEPPLTECLYKLHHHYDIGDQSLYFTFPKQLANATDLAVYLQFKAERLFDDAICLSSPTIMNYLTQFGAKEYKGKRSPCSKIDMYSDRELRCGTWHELYYPTLDKEYGEQAESFLKQDKATMKQAIKLRETAPNLPPINP